MAVANLGNGIMGAAVFDGHGGWQAAEHAQNTLLGEVKKALPGSDAELTENHVEQVGGNR